MKFSVAQDIGQRERQEDRWLADERMDLFAVCDGMGGHEKGDEAAEDAIHALHIAVANDQRGDPMRVFGDAIRIADEAVQRLAGGGVFRRPGTTLTALWLRDGAAYLLHVGDSSCYLHSNGALARISEQHTGIWGLEQCLGGGCRDLKDLRPQIERFSVSEGDTLILCSDGMVLDEMALAELCEMCPIEQIAGQIERESLEHKRAGDNVTVICIEVGP